MTVKLLGAVEHYTRVRTGSYSLDWALAGGPKGVLVPGYPMRTITILSGKMMSGKTTVALWLAGRIAGAGSIGGAFLEEYDENFMQTILEEASYNGEVQLVNGSQDEDFIDELDALAQDEKYSVVIFDSIGAILAISESEGKSGEANMGRRGLLTSKLMRRMRNRIRNRTSPLTLLAITHLHPNLGVMGNSLSGGVTQQYMASNILELSAYKDDEHLFSDGSQIITGLCRKVKFGPSNGHFALMNLAGWGPHLGLGAVVDCLALEIAEKAKGRKPVLLNDKSYGKWDDLIKAAKKGDVEIFQSFQDKLKKLEGQPAEPSTKKGRKKK